MLQKEQGEFYDMLYKKDMKDDYPNLPLYDHSCRGQNALTVAKTHDTNSNNKKSKKLKIDNFK